MGGAVEEGAVRRDLLLGLVEESLRLQHRVLLGIVHDGDSGLERISSWGFHVRVSHTIRRIREL